MADEGMEIGGQLATLLTDNLQNIANQNAINANKDKDDAATKASAEAQRVTDEKKSNTTEANASGKTEDQNGLSDEQIQGKLDDLAKKEETQLTEEDKKFIQQYTEEQLDEVNTARKHLESKYNVKIEGTFENSPEGLLALTEAATQVRAAQKVVTMLDTVPYMKEFYQHVVVEKRSIDTFLDKNRQPDFKTIKLEQVADANDEVKNNQIITNQKRLLTLDLVSKGMAQDDIDNLINIHEDKGTLFDKAKEAQNNLDKRYKENLDVKLKSEESRIKSEEATQEAIYNKAVAMLDSNNFEGLSLPSEDIKGFKEATTKVIDDDGNTLLDLKRSKLTLGQRMIIDYIVYKDLKNIGLTEAKTLNKKFSFKKAADINNERGGGRIKGGGDNFQQTQNLGNINFTKIKVEHQTI